MAGSLISDLHIRLTADELETLKAIGARKQAQPGAVVRAMVRHFLIQWSRGEDIITELGAISWGKNG